MMVIDQKEGETIQIGRRTLRVAGLLYRDVEVVFALLDADDDLDTADADVSPWAIDEEAYG